MPDLISHAMSGYLARPTAERRTLLLTVAGTVLPDLGRVPDLALATFWPALRYSLPDWLFDGLGISHTILPLLLICWVVSFLAPRPELRRHLFGCLLLGGGLHLAFDYLQRHLFWDYTPLYPLSSAGWEAGLFWSEDALFYIFPAMSVLTLAMWMFQRRKAS
ncbi:MAG TPA: metal-dependent hydrolase [Acidobacteriota bacterium]|nr:metal-dependent hydrolase [Acidobacteriota bacterium]